MHRAGNEESQRVASKGAFRSVGEKYQALQQMGKRGTVPNAPEFRYAKPGESATMMDGERVVRILQSIDQKLAPTP
jgi:hypothetical protein